MMCQPVTGFEPVRGALSAVVDNFGRGVDNSMSWWKTPRLTQIALGRVYVQLRFVRGLFFL
jgi:hypothetical protein